MFLLGNWKKARDGKVLQFFCLDKNLILGVFLTFLDDAPGGRVWWGEERKGGGGGGCIASV